MLEQPRQMKDIEIGFVRKSDGKILNFKLIDIFKSFCHADYVNNEVRINGEVLIADSFQRPYYEVVLNVQKNCLNGAAGSYQVNGNIYDSNQSISVEKNSRVQITLLPAQGSVVKSVTDENNNNYLQDNNVVSIGMDTDHVITIVFDIIERAK